MKKETIYILGGIAVLIIIFTVILPIMRKFGVFRESKRSKRKDDVREMQKSEIFNPKYHEGKIGKKLGNPLAEQYAKDIKKSLRSVRGDDEDTIFATFAKLDNKQQVSELAAMYYSLYKKDMRASINKNFSNREEAKLWDIVKSLPEF